MTEKQTQDAQSTGPDKGHLNTCARKSDDGTLPLILFFLVALTILTSMALAWPQIYEFMKSGPPQPVTVTELGAVQRITYIGGLATHTQIDLKNQSVLVMGAALLENATLLELRSQGNRAKVCVVSTERCWTRLGH